MSESPTRPQATELTSRAILALSGADAVPFLDGLVTNDVERLTEASALYAGLLSPQGKLLFDFLLARDGETILIDVDAGQAAALASRLGLYKLRAKVTIEARADWAVATVPEAQEIAPPMVGVAFVDPRHSRLGARLLVARAALQAGADSEAYHTLRLGLGIGEGPEIGGERTYPLEANFEPLHGVDFRKGCYVGQELTARMKHRGGLRKRVVPIRFEGAPAPVDAALSADGKEIGTVLAARGPLGLALVRLDRLAEAGAAPLRAADSAVTLHWPDWLPQLASAAS